MTPLLTTSGTFILLILFIFFNSDVWETMNRKQQPSPITPELKEIFKDLI
jgi:hypothetical protein